MPGDQQSGPSLCDILKIASARVVYADPDHIAPRLEIRANIHFIIRPMRMESSCRSAADEATVDEKSIRLIRCDEERGACRNPLQIERLPEKGVAVLNVPMVGIRPDPFRFDKGGLHRRALERGDIEGVSEVLQGDFC